MCIYIYIYTHIYTSACIYIYIYIYTHTYHNCLHFSSCACHPCAGAMLIFSASFQFQWMIPEGNPCLQIILGVHMLGHTRLTPVYSMSYLCVHIFIYIYMYVRMCIYIYIYTHIHEYQPYYSSTINVPPDLGSQ